MRNAKMVLCLGAFAACVGVPSLSVAEDNCSGHQVQVGSMSITMSNDPSLPGYPGIGECHGAGGVGNCTYKDKDGDEWTTEWKSVTGVTGKYTWKVVSGTGKFAKAKGSGWSQHTRKEGDVRISVWGGNCN
jgi:hypothetical protein